MPELAINEGNVLFSWFTKMFSNRVDDTVHTSCCFTDALFKNHCCATIDKSNVSEDASFVESVIYPGENLIYKNQGRNATVKIISSKVGKDGILEYTVEFSSGEAEEVPREYLSRPETPDIASIPSTIPELREAAQQLQDTDLKSILNPKPLSPAEQEFLDLHHRLLHLPYPIMFRLAKAGLLPKHFSVSRNAHHLVHRVFLGHSIVPIGGRGRQRIVRSHLFVRKTSLNLINVSE